MGEGASRKLWAGGLGSCVRGWGQGNIPALLYRLFSLTLRIKDSLSKLFARCGHVQSVDICEKPGPGEKKEKLASKFFNRKTVTVKLGGVLEWSEWKKMNGTIWNMRYGKPFGGIG